MQLLICSLMRLLLRILSTAVRCCWFVTSVVLAGLTTLLSMSQSTKLFHDSR